MVDEILSALDAIQCADCTRDEWIQVGMALKDGGYGVETWDAWSARDSARYRTGECERKWNGFHGTSNPVTVGTIFHMAQERGWRHSDADYALEWDSYIEYDGDSPSDMPDMSPTEQLLSYLRVLFQPDDIVGYVTTDTRKLDDGKWVPSSSGVYTRTCRELCESLQKYPDDLGATIGDWKDKAGAWIRFNPLDGKGAGNANVTSFRFALVESDEMPINEQIAKYEQLQLPIAAMVFSGGKSMHAIVRIDARDAKEYTDRVNYLYNYLEKNGMKVDRQNRNPSRLSRMPGVTRNGEMQKLRGVNIGKPSWTEWMDYVEGIDDALPPIITLEDAFANPIMLPEELIQGVLRRGHKMLLSSTSKAGKSFLMMELAIAIANGGKWLGFQCKQGRVLYANLEIDPASCIQRFKEIYKALGYPKDQTRNVTIWNLRGKALPLDQLVPKLLRRVRDMNLDAIILDPLYKILTGDENSASDMAYFCNQFDRIAAETGCSVIYCHHHSKGSQGWKKAIDRASGSGVFARDPDAILDMTELELTDEVLNLVADRGDTAFRLEGSLREFRAFKPKNFWFRWPVHVLDETGELERMSLIGSPQAYGRTGGERAGSSRRDVTAEQYISAWEEGSMGDPEAAMTEKEFSTILGVSLAGVNKWMKSTGDEYFEKLPGRPARYRPKG